MLGDPVPGGWIRDLSLWPDERCLQGAQGLPPPAAGLMGRGDRATGGPLCGSGRTGSAMERQVLPLMRKHVKVFQQQEACRDIRILVQCRTCYGPDHFGGREWRPPTSA